MEIKTNPFLYYLTFPLHLVFTLVIPFEFELKDTIQINLLCLRPVKQEMLGN